MFGVKYNCLTDDAYQFVPQALHDSSVRINVLIHLPFLKRLVKLGRWLFPAAMRGRKQLINFVSLLLRDHESLADDKSVFSFLELAHDPQTKQNLDKQQARGEAVLLVVAGTDTTSTAIAATLFYLSKSPNSYQRLAMEIRSKFQSSADIRWGSALNSCVYLRACIDEALRMSPPGAGAPFREVGPGGMTVDSLVVPEGVDVGVGIYSIHHNDAYFDDPFRYQPERWLDSEHGERGVEAVALCKSAFMAFSRGARDCVGKGFAYKEMMLALAHIMYKMDFRHADDWVCPPWSRHGTTSGEEFGLRDHFTASKYGPFLLFRQRETTIETGARNE